MEVERHVKDIHYPAPSRCPDSAFMWRIVEKTGTEDVAFVYRAVSTVNGRDQVEFAESVAVPSSRDEKWVLVISSFLGCPVGCTFCDAGLNPGRPLTCEEILSQADLMVSARYPDGRVPAEKFKVQFARVGEPMLNPHALDALEALTNRWRAPGLLPCVSTMAPAGSERLFDRLMDIRRRVYGDVDFQLQFSVHSTNEVERQKLFGIRSWTLEEISDWGSRFHIPGKRKVTLNFALHSGAVLDPRTLASVFPTDHFIVKLTPLNPTITGRLNGLASTLDNDSPESASDLVDSIKDSGFECILSIGNPEENALGSNCGQTLASAR